MVCEIIVITYSNNSVYEDFFVDAKQKCSHIFIHNATRINIVQEAQQTEKVHISQR